MSDHAARGPTKKVGLETCNGVADMARPRGKEKSPMTVRWKPLIVLSGLFLVIAVVGLLVVTLDLVPADSGEIMTTAREEWKGGRHGNAQIHFLRALQADPKNGKIYAELAKMYREWWEQETDPAKRAELRLERLSALADASKYGKDPAPGASYCRTRWSTATRFRPYSGPRS